MINVLVYAIQIAYLCRVLFGLCCFYSHIIRTVLTEMKDSNNQNTRKEKNMKKLSLLMAGLLLTAGMFAQTVTKTVNELQSANNWTISAGNEIGTMATEFALDEVITISTTGEPNCGSVWNSKNDVMDWRIYQAKSGNIIITAADGYVMTSVTLVYGNSNNGVLLDGDKDKNVVASDTEYALDKVSEVIFVVGKSKEDGKTNGQARVTSFTITYEKNGGVTIAKPTFAPETTEFEDKIEVTITTSKSNVIYYTLDGPTPTASSTLYNGPITLTETTTVKAIAYNEVEKAASGIASQTYTKKEAAKVNTIAEVETMAKDAEATVEGQVVALASEGAVLQDATGLIYCYQGVSELKVGNRVRATAVVSDYGNAKQLNKSVFQVLGTEEVIYPKAETWTATEMEAWIASGKVVKKYVTLEGTLTISGKYINLTVEGATNKASLVQPKEDISALNNSIVKVTGYAMYVTGSSSKYAYIVATDIEETMPQNIETFTSLDALAAANLTSGTLVEVTLTKMPIKKIYANKSNQRLGIYFDVQKEEKDIEIFFSSEEMPDEWTEGGLLSGTITGTWTRYEYKEFRNWEIVPTNTWHWTNLKYEAGSTPVEEVTADKKARKVVENGVIYIIRNGVRYNVFGGQTE